ncbi:hypothetical protein PYW07_005773 [Mythimna separata]|uniref:Peptidase M14 domain-containing protein n=1 Tax=Mythimna separata TaxID=271217 RepID=A0AAD7YKJ1_MYTSE|nr:hypothetical protein PYW07_005773 [Mythimna separata]
MNWFIFCLVASFVVNFHENNAQSRCGCKTIRPCYKEMLGKLLDRDEAGCIEDAAIGASTVTIFLKAIREYCGKFLTLVTDHMTFEGRHLYEVVLSAEKQGSRTDQHDPNQPKPVIIIEAGQTGGSEPVGLALFVVEQLVACEENEDLLRRVTWVVLPCTNPDGQEYSRFSQAPWKKNLRQFVDQLSYGVDITRNFDVHWNSVICEKADSSFSQTYPGPAVSSENETKFIKAVIAKHRQNAKVYLSLKGDGHAILYPYAHTAENRRNTTQLRRVAGELAARVNQRASGVHIFDNRSIFDADGKPHCGHSVDYAYENGVPLAYEMRVFLGSDNAIMSMFQQMPRGYDTSLRNGYFSGIRELFNVLTNEKKYGKI